MKWNGGLQMVLVVDLSIYVFICLSTEFILFEMNRR